MSKLRHGLDAYLSLRRALGFKLERAGRLLPDFIEYLEARGEEHITVKRSLEWATRPDNASARWSSDRLALVRQFARYLHASDPRTEIPDAALIPYQAVRQTPYIYADEEITALLKAAQRLQGPLRAATYTTLLGLLSVTGMRVGEAIALERPDVDWQESLLIVRHSKFGKSREVVLHETTRDALRRYARMRDRYIRQPRSPSFFLSQCGTRPFYANIHKTFLALVRETGLEERYPRRPRIHDLRHTFAVKTLVGWYRAGEDVQARLPALSTYLGHTSPLSTYWYLTATPELLMLAANRLERAWQEQS